MWSTTGRGRVAVVLRQTARRVNVAPQCRRRKTNLPTQIGSSSPAVSAGGDAARCGLSVLSRCAPGTTARIREFRNRCRPKGRRPTGVRATRPGHTAERSGERVLFAGDREGEERLAGRHDIADRPGSFCIGKGRRSRSRLRKLPARMVAPGDETTEREGFEPPVQLPVHRISSAIPSAARTPLPIDQTKFGPRMLRRGGPHRSAVDEDSIGSWGSFNTSMSALFTSPCDKNGQPTDWGNDLAREVDEFRSALRPELACDLARDQPVQWFRLVAG